MKKTLFRQLLLYMVVFGIILSVVSFLIIDIYFDDYYHAQEEKALLKHTLELAEEYNKTGITGLQSMIDTYYRDYGLSVYFLETETQTLYGTSLQGPGRQSIYSAFSYKNVDNLFISSTGNAQNKGSDWLSYLLETDDGNLLLGRFSYASINSVILLVQKFFLFFGIAVAFTFIVFAFFFSRSMSNPLKKLNAIAEQMGRLDFSMRYEGTRQDEIGHLGNTLNELTTKLENTITQLTGELSKEKTLEKMRTQFTAQVSHELQTPLSVIKGYAEALSDNLFAGEEANDAYTILLNETEKISNMVDDLLDLSQMEAGAYIIRKNSFLFPDLIQKIYNHYNALPHIKNFSMNLEIDFPPSLSYYGDSLRLEQAIRNILTNAIKHVRENGSINMSLSFEKEKTHITISNQGKHIPEYDIPYIFDSYYQGKSSKGGSGLGLAITRHIIGLHAGNISVANIDDGVLFEFFLP